MEILKCNAINKAIAYVASHLDKGEVNLTYELMFIRREPMFSVNYSLSDEIYDLMEEYGQDNDLAEGWWLAECDEEEVFLKVYDFINCKKD